MRRIFTKILHSRKKRNQAMIHGQKADYSPRYYFAQNGLICLKGAGLSGKIIDCVR